MKIQLSDHFTSARLLRFTLPSIVMMIFTSIYSVVDGFFISNFVGITPFASVNLVMPLMQMLSCVGFMFGAGGSALVSAMLGMGEREKAERTFSLLVYVTIGCGVFLAAVGFAFLQPILTAMGADAALLPYCLTYGRILLLSLPAFMLQNLFQCFLVTAEKPKLGLYVTVGAGLTNIVLDALFIVVFRWSVAGAAAATALAQCVGGLVPLAYFARKNSSLLRLRAPRPDGRALLRTCTNGASELVSNLSMSVVSMLYNYQLMRLAGQDGVAAYGAVMYVGFVFSAVFLGYSIGVAPVVGFHFGAQNEPEVRGLLRRSNGIILIASVAMAALGYGLSAPLARLFVGDGAQVLAMTVKAFHYYALSVLFSGFSVFGSAFFTALGDGGVSAAISFLRTLVFQIASVLLLPLVLGLDGVWYSLLLAEVLSVGVTLAFYQAKRKKYRYF